MSILNFGPLSVADVPEALASVIPMLEEALGSPDLEQSDRLKLINAGFLPRDLFDLTDDEMDALFQLGYQWVYSGSFDKARAIFRKLSQLDWFDARYPYALAVVHQLEGDFQVAAKTYAAAIALDALWVDAYIRIGECLIAAGEHEDAHNFLLMAITLAGSTQLMAKIEAEELVAGLVSAGLVSPKSPTQPKDNQ